MREEEIQLVPEELDGAKKLLGLTEEEAKEILPNLTKMQKRFIRHFPEYWDRRVIAEVVEAKNCIHGAKVGDRFILGGMGSWNGGTFQCIWAAAIFLNYAAYTLSDLVMSGLDPTVMGQDVIRCPGVSLEDGGGCGTVLFKLHPSEKLKLTKEDLPDDMHRPGVNDILLWRKWEKK